MWLYRTAIVHEGEVGLLYENGRFVSEVSPGRRTLINLPWAREDLKRVDVRRRELTITGQDVLTSEAISVRVSIAAEFRVVNPAMAVNGVSDYAGSLHSALQLILRDEVQSRTIEQLLADRAALSGNLLERGRSEASALGLELTRAAVRDITLPGEVKKMLSQEFEALRAGRAALVAAREETAATRAKANTAQLLATNPVLLRLREIEAIAQVGSGYGNTVVLAIPTDALSGLAALGKGS